MNYVEILKNEISKQNFVNKHELKTYLDQALIIIKSNEELKKSFQEFGLFSDIDTVQREFYNYYFKFYDQTHANETSLNVEDITSFSVDGKYFIKYRDKNGDYRVIENNDPSKNYIEQIKEKQESSIDFQINDGITNKYEVLKSMSEERKEIDFLNPSTASTESMTVEERDYFNTFVNHEMFQNRNLKMNIYENICIDKDTGEIFNIVTNEQGLKEIRKINESYTMTDKKEGIEYNENIESEIKEIESAGLEIDYSSLTESDLYYMVENKDGNFSEEMIENAQSEIDKRNQKLKETNNTITKEKPKVLVLTMNDKRGNGFANVLSLSLITTLYGVAFLIYLYMLVK